MTTAAFPRDPIAHFGASREAMHDGPPAERERLQLEALRDRFAQLRGRLPALDVLADEAALYQVRALEDIAPLLLAHTVYKSYPASLLASGRFDRLTRWLQRLTTLDLSGVDASGCESVDSWLDLLDTTTDLRVAHSSGTSGTLSFLPHTHRQFDDLFRIVGLDVLAPDGAPVDVVWPSYRYGRSGIARCGRAMAERYARTEDRFHALHPGPMSADVMYLAGRLRSAALRGDRAPVEVPPSLSARHRELLEAQRPGEAMAAYARDLAGRLAGRRVIAMNTWNLLYAVSRAGLAQGLENVFAADSVVMPGGGAKNQAVPDDWQDTVRRFFGVPRLRHIYALSEVMALNDLCTAGRYHIDPWVVLYVLDPLTGRPLPRTGKQTGRAAFFDLMAEVHWGGFASGDRVSADYSPCSCGRTTPHLDRRIERYDTDQGGDDKITCAAAPEAHAQALDFLEATRV
ncbi:hypothetical protein [Streptomyces sp. NBC_00091]|uniref:hypothetical protein n=1 Tax=Streptomyces sp. NBC_00091 TaxID=2975648 RepID=UPI00224D9A8F|nr:hypothetical protein [Streptomyces sp. NBC_00091]MCX5381595.1 hypothetical protein [Streptomyces sp. NBC_00091]